MRSYITRRRCKLPFFMGVCGIVLPAMDATVVKCKNCGAEIEITDAFAHQIEEEVARKLERKHAQTLADAVKAAEQRASEKAAKDVQLKLETAVADAREERERNKKLMQDVSHLTDELRALRRQDEERELRMKKTLAEEEAKIREDARKKAMEEHELKDREKDQNYQVALKQIEELKAKLQQGSQQAQGESLELALEELLRREFPRDVIEEVKKGQRGADIVQHVIDKNGRECGVMLWESKNAQWSDAWIPKLKEDQRIAKSDVAILVVTNLPRGGEHSLYENQVWVCPRNEVIPLAMSLRYGLIRVQFERSAHMGKEEKKEILYRYITSLEFRQRMEAITEAFSAMQEEVEREKRWFSTKWARQEKQLRKVIDHTHGMYGDLQGVVGSLPELKGPELGSTDSEPFPLLEDKPF